MRDDDGFRCRFSSSTSDDIYDDNTEERNGGEMSSFSCALNVMLRDVRVCECVCVCVCLRGGGEFVVKKFTKTRISHLSIYFRLFYFVRTQMLDENVPSVTASIIDGNSDRVAAVIHRER